MAEVAVAVEETEEALVRVGAATSVEESEVTEVTPVEVDAELSADSVDEVEEAPVTEVEEPPVTEVDEPLAPDDPEGPTVTLEFSSKEQGERTVTGDEAVRVPLY